MNPPPCLRPCCTLSDLGDVRERVKTLEDAGQLSLAYLTAASHGLEVGSPWGVAACLSCACLLSAASKLM